MNKKLFLNILTLIMFFSLPFTAYAESNTTNTKSVQTQNEDKQQNNKDMAYHEPNGYDKIAHRSMIALAIAIVMGLATLGGTIAQGFVGASAINGIAKNPGAKSSMQTMLILIMVLIESIVIYALVIAILLFTKL